jgi:nitroimidazol reductase NimA-like FMN-containing flavoprotein (pyridoxamine 5'-phosphate oxidase superfamily)
MRYRSEANPIEEVPAMTSQPPESTYCPAGLTPEEWARAEQVLIQAPFAFFSMIDRGRPYVVPMNYAYEQSPGGAAPAVARDAVAPRLIFHTGRGRKSAALAADPHICAAITTGETFVHGATPCADGYAFRSVLVEGSALPVTDDSERVCALRSLVAKYDPAATDHLFDQEVLGKTLVYELVIEKVGYREIPD